MSKNRRLFSREARRAGLLGALLAVVSVCLLATAASAFAYEGRIVSHTIGSPGELNLKSQSSRTPSGIAVNEETHDIYVADTGNGDVARFKADGTPLGTFGSLESPTFIAVDNSGGASQGTVYVVTGGNGIAKFSATGVLDTAWGEGGVLHGFGRVDGIAVEAGGTLVVVSEERAQVTKLEPDGTEPSPSFEIPELATESGIAVDSKGNIYFITVTGHGWNLIEYSSGGRLISKELNRFEETVTAVALGATTDVPYVLHAGNSNIGSYVETYEPECGEECAATEKFGRSDIDLGSSIAVDSSLGPDGTIYVPEPSSNTVKVFGPSVVAPDVSVAPPSVLQPERATFVGTVDPLGITVTGCEFQYYSLAPFGYVNEGMGESPLSAPCEGGVPSASGGSQQVEASVEGLEPNATYILRLVVETGQGQNASKTTFNTIEFGTTTGASGLTTTSAQLNGIVAPEGVEVSDCYFEWGENGEFGIEFTSTVPCTGSYPTDHSNHPVSAQVTGLQREGSYGYRLVIERGGEVLVGQTQRFEAAGVHVRNSHSRSVGETEATLEGEANPRSNLFEYFFEYGTTSAYGQKTPVSSAGSEEPASATAWEPVNATLKGLLPHTTYHWRLVVIDPFGEIVSEDQTVTTFATPSAPDSNCPNQQFRTGPSALLPDCRAYEQASPVNKGGGNVEAVPDMIQSTESGDGITFYSQSGIPGGVGAQDYPSYLATRSGEAWNTQGLLPPQETGEEAGYLGLAGGGRYAVTLATKRGSEEGSALFIRDLTNGTMTTAVPYQSQCIQSCWAYAGSNSDGSKIFLEAAFPVTGEAPAGQWDVYVWDRETGDITPVSVYNPEGSSTEPRFFPQGGFAGAYNWTVSFDEGTTHGGAKEHMYVGPIHAISRDGSQVVFTSWGSEEEELEYRGQLYLRKNPTRPQSPVDSNGKCTVAADACTIRISEPEAGLPDPQFPAIPAAFLEATPDGHYIFFKSAAKLTQDAYAGEEGRSKNLYRYDTSTETLTDLTPDPTEANAEGPGVQGMLGASESGNSVYFSANGVLTTEPGPGGATPVAGEANLYRYVAGANPPLSFVATLTGGSIYESYRNDFRDWSPATVIPTNSGSPEAKTARVSSDGQTVFFRSRQQLAGPEPEARGCSDRGVEIGEPPISCAEIFRYSAAQNSIECISCAPTGAQPLGNAIFTTQFFNASEFPFYSPAPTLSHNMSADGKRFFFETPDALVPEDVNGKAGCSLTATDFQNLTCLDVYEWEAPGTGTCTQAEVNGGCIHLLSSGQDDQPSFFGDADSEGRNAFIFTEAQLVPSDRDHLYDAYDVSENGGLASQNSSPPVRCASQQACQGQGASPAPSATPGTSTFAGPGNPKPHPKKCKKGAKKCKKHHHKKKHHKHKTKHGKKRAAGRNQGGAK